MWKASCAAMALVAMMQPVVATEVIEIGPPSSNGVAQLLGGDSNFPILTHQQKLELLQQKIKYVFVLYQENRSFDHYFGTFPGANGLFWQPGIATPPTYQLPIVLHNGTVTTISPFLIPQTVQNNASPPQTVQIYPADIASSDHSHSGIDNGVDVVSGVPQNDRFALNAEGFSTYNGKIVLKGTTTPWSTPPSEAQVQMAELTVGHLDCDTVPFLWQYADTFTLFDNFAMTIIGPSAPNAVAMIAGQTGETQLVLHPTESSANTSSPSVAESGGEPDVTDAGPFAGSHLDTSAGAKPPYGPNDESPLTPALNQTYASLPLSFMGNQIRTLTASDEDAVLDLADVQDDIGVIAKQNSIAWGWYQEGYDHEPTDPTQVATYDNYITHHNGPQYFGYVGDNPKVASNMHGLNDFYVALADQTLSRKGGVYFVRGGYGNNDGMVPLDPNPTVRADYPGNDDHPGYSDAQISEALLADEINAIAASPYWAESAIIITYDETDGMWDHVPPTLRLNDPEGNALSGGQRIPAIVISPYSVAHGISHEYSEHSSVIKFIDELFNLTPLADLPDEVKARQLGEAQIGNPNMGPADDIVPNIGDLFSAFDNSRLTGITQPIPASYAEIPASVVHLLPHYPSGGCATLHIVPTDYKNGTLIDPAPADFNPRPKTNPGIPTVLGSGTGGANWQP